MVFIKRIGNNPTGSFAWRNAADSTTLMTLTNTGLLGIGITNPANLLHVSQTASGLIASFRQAASPVAGNLCQVASYVDTTIGCSFGSEVNSGGDVGGFLELKRFGPNSTYLYSDDAGNLRIVISNANFASQVGEEGGTIVGTQTSDARLKENVISTNYGMNTILQLNPVEFNLIAEPSKKRVGFIAQEALFVVPESVYNAGNDCDENGNIIVEDSLRMDYVQLIPILTKALQELKQQFDDYVAAHP